MREVYEFRTRGSNTYSHINVTFSFDTRRRRRASVGDPTFSHSPVILRFFNLHLASRRLI